MYIKYPQAEELLKSYPKLKSYLKILQIELERLFREGKTEDINPDDILYSLAIGNRILSDMPHATSSPEDKMINVIIAKDRIINNEIMKELMQTLNTIGEVVEKTTSALTCLTSQEWQIISDKYFKKRTWKETLRSNAVYVDERQARRIRQNSIEKMLPLLRITMEQFEFCMERVRKDG